MNKIKVFFGAYINNSNAQNLNCLTLSKFIDKDVFTVYTMSIKHGNFGKIAIPGVNVFTCTFPVRITSFFGYIWGIWNCDVAYLPRGNNFKFQRLLLRLFKKKSFKTIENIIDEESLQSALSIFPSMKEVYENYQFTDRLYSITNFMKIYNWEKHGLNSEEMVLPLVIDTETFAMRRDGGGLREIVFIGNDMKRKRVVDYLEVAKQFDQLVFHVIGRDPDCIVERYIGINNLTNVYYHGELPHYKILKVLQKCQLHVLPSKSEGFPRGIIECAAAGLPTITYSDFGASEWITNFVNGVVCKDVGELKHAVDRFLKDSKLLKENINGAYELAEEYNAKKITNLYEKVIKELYYE